MSLDIVIDSINYKPCAKNGIKEPRPRFIQYYKDLYSHLGSEIEEAVFKEGSQATYSELGEAILTECNQSSILSDLDLMVVAYWAYEFDPDHASCGAYLCEKFNLDCKMFDVCEQGSIAPFTAIKIINSFIKNAQINKAVLLILEQTTIPRNKNDFDLVPSEAGAVSLILGKAAFTQNGIDEKNQYRIVNADVILDNRMVESSQDIMKMILNVYFNNLDSERMTYIYLRKNSYLWNIFQYHAKEIPPTVCVKPFSSQAGSLQPWFALHNEFNKTSNVQNSPLPNLIMLDQDVESLSTGILVLEPTIKRGVLK